MRAVLRPPDIAQTVVTLFAADHIEGVLETNTGVTSPGAPLRLVRHQAPFPAANLSEDRRAPKQHTFVVTARGEDTDSSRNSFRTTEQAPSFRYHKSDRNSNSITAIRKNPYID